MQQKSNLKTWNHSDVPLNLQTDSSKGETTILWRYKISHLHVCYPGTYSICCSLGLRKMENCLPKNSISQNCKSTFLGFFLLDRKRKGVFAKKHFTNIIILSCLRWWCKTKKNVYRGEVILIKDIGLTAPLDLHQYKTFQYRKGLCIESLQKAADSSL